MTPLSEKIGIFLVEYGNTMCEIDKIGNKTERDHQKAMYFAQVLPALEKIINHFTGYYNKF